MKFIAASLLAMIPAIAWAQQTPLQQSSMPTLQQMLDQKSAEIADRIAQFRGQITQDQSLIATLSQQNSDLATKSGALEKQVANLQEQLKAATGVKDPAK